MSAWWLSPPWPRVTSKGSLALILPTIVGPLRSQGRGRPCLSIVTWGQGSKSTWMFPAAGGAVERFAGAHPPHYRGSPHKAAAGHAFRSAPGARALNPRGCFRRPEGPSKGSLALILPTIVGPPSAHKAADGHAFRSAPETRALRSTDI